MGGLCSSFGDVLVGQDLAQPGMLVVHVPSLPAAQLLPSDLVEDWLSLASSEWR
jgi:hypothetical protein